MIVLLLLLNIILIAFLLNVFLNLKSLTTLDLNLLILKKSLILFLYLLLCVLLLFGLLLLGLIMLETNTIIALKYVIQKSPKTLLLLDSTHFSILVWLFSTGIITIMFLLFWNSTLSFMRSDIISNQILEDRFFSISISHVFLHILLYIYFIFITLGRISTSYTMQPSQSHHTRLDKL